MSIKIWEAYRLKRKANLFKLLADIKHRGQMLAKGRLQKLFEDVLDGRSHMAALQLEQQEILFKEWVKTLPGTANDETRMSLYARWMETDCPPEIKLKPGVLPVDNLEVLKLAKREAVEGVKPGVFDVDAWAHAKYGEQLTRHERHPWALDTCVTVRKYRERYYLIPYYDRACLLNECLAFMADDERLEDFAYWNNTDPPDDVKEHTWTWRGIVWGAMTQPERWCEYVALDIVSWHGWSEVSPMVELLREREVTS